MFWFLIFTIELAFIFYSGKLLQKKVFQKSGLWIFAFLYLPATYIHEMSHYLVAQLVGVPSELNSFVPRKQGNHIVLGSVSIAKTGFVKRFVIGIAPFIIGGLLTGVLFYAYELRYFTDWQVLIFVFLLFQSVNSMYLSREDLRGIKWLVYVGLMIVLYALYLSSGNFLVLENLRAISKLMLVPIGFNLLVSILLRVF